MNMLPALVTSPILCNQDLKVKSLLFLRYFTFIEPVSIKDLQQLHCDLVLAGASGGRMKEDGLLFDLLELSWY